ncbi:hypothetical protein KAR28_02505 [Candidatus Parcubacteria bacterium]|nr:hypothetical protein [Candidatus Parcubacteria bacterium]
MEVKNSYVLKSIGLVFKNIKDICLIIGGGGLVFLIYAIEFILGFLVAKRPRIFRSDPDPGYRDPDALIEYRKWPKIFGYRVYPVVPIGIIGIIIYFIYR